MNKTNISRIISGKPDRGLNKYMLEEVYFSDSCFNKDKYNPQNARFVDGRYYFDLPDFWYNHLSNNKAVALRKIDIHAPTLNIEVHVLVQRVAKASGVVKTHEIPVFFSVSPGMSTQDIINQICREANKLLSPKSPMKWITDPDYTVALSSVYNYEKNEVEFKLERSYNWEISEEKYYFAFSFSKIGKDFIKLLNLDESLLNMTYNFVDADQVSDGTTELSFSNVWNREFCFVHASFVNGTSFNYLGRSGEFYPKPSKMYRFGGSSQQFYFELSFDGRTPIKHTLGNFCIDLAFIYHDKDYQAE